MKLILWQPSVLLLLFPLINGEEEIIPGYPLKWEDIEEDMGKTFNLHYKTGSKRSLKRLGKGETKGLMSKVFVVTFDWQGKDAHAKTLPSQATMKIISRADTERFFKLVEQNKDSISSSTFTRLAHDQELFLYGNVSKLDLPQLKFPKYYTGRPFDEQAGWGYLLIEFVDNIIVKHIYDHFEDSEILQGLDLLATLNGLSLRYKPVFSKFINSHIYDNYIESVFNKQKRAKYLNIYIENHPERTNQVKRLLQVTKTFGNRTDTLRRIESTCPMKMATHGDLWPPNVFWTQLENRDLKLRAIVDFQYTHYGNPLFDILKWFSFTIHPKDYLNKKDKFLRHYYESLIKYAAGQKIAWENYEDFVKGFELMYVWRSVEMAHSLEVIKGSIINDLPIEKQSEINNLFKERYFVMLDESMRILNQRENLLL